MENLTIQKFKMYMDGGKIEIVTNKDHFIKNKFK